MNNIYLISSDSVRLLNDEVNKIVSGNNYATFDLNIISIDDVLEEAAYVSLFDEKKYMVVKNANIFATARRKKDEEEGSSKSSKKYDSLLDYLANPNPKTVLIFTLIGKIDSKKKICSIIKNSYSYIEVGFMKSYEIENALSKILNDEKYKISSDILKYIVSNSLNNYDLAYNEIEKIKLYYGKPCTIKKEDVYSIVSKTMEESSFKFVSAVMKRDLKEAFRIFDDLMIQKVEPAMLLVMLSKELRNTLLVKKMMNSYSKNDLINILDIKYSFQLDKILENVYIFKEKELEGYLLKLAEFDYKFKSGKMKGKIALELIILDICS